MYSCFLSGATLALYHGSPLGHGFGKFVQVIPPNFISKMLMSVLAKETKQKVLSKKENVAVLKTNKSLRIMYCQCKALACIIIKCHHGR
jgi:hypothetical protein